MVTLTCMFPGGYPSSARPGLSTTWPFGVTRQVSAADAEYLHSTFPGLFVAPATVAPVGHDRMMRPVAVEIVAKRWDMDARVSEIVPAIKSGEHDRWLGEMRNDERSGQNRKVVLNAIDVRARKIIKAD